MQKRSDSKLVCLYIMKLYMDLCGFTQAAGMRSLLILWSISR